MIPEELDIDAGYSMDVTLINRSSSSTVIIARSDTPSRRGIVLARYIADTLQECSVEICRSITQNDDTENITALKIAGDKIIKS